MLLGLVVQLMLAADWPQYRGPNRDAVAPDLRVPTVWPGQLEKRWEVPLGGGFSSPAVADGRCFVISQEGGDEVVQALDAATGRPIWRHAYPAHFTSGWGDGPRATPTVDGPRVYTVGGAGDMYCLNAADGKVNWQKSFKQAFRFRVPTYGYSPSPLIDGDRVIVHTGGRRGDSVVALDKRTGAVVWSAESDPAGYASPMIVPASETRGPRQLIVFTELGLVSLNPDTGERFWRYDWQTSYEQNIAQPMLDGDVLVITSLTGCAALRLVAQRGSAGNGVRPQQKDIKGSDPISGQPTFRVAWRNQNMAVHFSCPVTRAGYMYGVHGRGGALRCLNLKDGSVAWTHDLATRERGDIVLAGDGLIIYTDTGQLIVADASPAAYRERARLTVAGHNWVPPVLAGGCLYLRDDRSLRCLVLPLEGRGS